jgi:hypothetical protein
MAEDQLEHQIRPGGDSIDDAGAAFGSVLPEYRRLAELQVRHDLSESAS